MELPCFLIVMQFLLFKLKRTFLLDISYLVKRIPSALGMHQGHLCQHLYYPSINSGSSDGTTKCFRPIGRCSLQWSQASLLLEPLSHHCLYTTLFFLPSIIKYLLYTALVAFFYVIILLALPTGSPYGS
jgi:hypothetical protein